MTRDEIVDYLREHASEAGCEEHSAFDSFCFQMRDRNYSSATLRAVWTWYKAGWLDRIEDVELSFRVWFEGATRHD